MDIIQTDWNDPVVAAMRSRVIDIVEKHYRQYQMVIKAKGNKDLEEFVIASTPQLSDPKYSFMQRVEWVFSGRTAFPVCQNESCCKVLDDPKYFHSIRKGYSHHCCMSCSTSDQAVKEKRADTMIALHGSEYWRDMEKDHETRLIRHGSPTWNNVEAIKQTKFERYGDENWNNPEKASQTYMERTGYSNPAQNPEVQARQRTVYVLTCERNDGFKPYYGSGIHKECCMPEHGYKSIMQLSGVDQVSFDAAPELAYYIWLADRGIDFQFHDGSFFVYEYAGQTHRYFPDFRVGQKYHEIKGDQFFRADGTMYLPWRKKDWSDAEYEDICGRYEAKHQCMIANSVKIIRKAEYAEYMDYVERKYGKGFLDSCRVNKFVPSDQ